MRQKIKFFDNAFFVNCAAKENNIYNLRNKNVVNAKMLHKI